MKNFGKIFCASLLLLGIGTLTACVEPARNSDSNLPASGAPKSWEGGMPGMGGGLVPEDR